MPVMSDTLRSIKEASLSGNIKVMIGGAPTTDEFAKQIGADFRGTDAYAAVNRAKSWLSK